MTTTPPTRRTPRASCRVVCSLAVLLVTLGGLPLLLAAEPTAAAIRPAVAATTAVSGRSTRPAVRRTATADFAATVAHAARTIECVPGGCGFLRTRSLDARALDWSSLERRALAVTLSKAETRGGFQPRASAWIQGSLCELGCADALRVPHALHARF